MQTQSEPTWLRAMNALTTSNCNAYQQSLLFKVLYRTHCWFVLFHLLRYADSQSNLLVRQSQLHFNCNFQCHFLKQQLRSLYHYLYWAEVRERVQYKTKDLHLTSDYWVKFEGKYVFWAKMTSVLAIPTFKLWHLCSFHRESGSNISNVNTYR